MGPGLQVFKLRIPKERRFERAARASAANIARQAGLPENRVEDVKTAVSEAVLNAIEHSRLEGPSPKILLTFTMDATRLKIDVKDPGAAFDPGKVPTPCIQDKLAPEASKRGWGLYLIEKLADECNIESVEGEGNTISMVIHLKP